MIQVKSSHHFIFQEGLGYDVDDPNKVFTIYYYRGV